MRQAITRSPRIIALEDGDGPGTPGPGQALVDIASVGICGSDYELWTGSDPYSRFPIRQGHEFSARIRAFGEGDTRGLQVGQLVAVEPLLPDGSCIACRHGRPNCCRELRVFGAHVDGALTDQLVVPIANLYAVGDLDPDLAAFVEPISIGLQMVTRSRLLPGDQAVIFGAGPIGQAVQLVALDLGARVAAVDVVPGRLERAISLGAELAIDARESDVVDAIGTWTVGEGARVVFEATGVPAVLGQAIEVVAHAGTVVVAGTSNQAVEIPTMSIVRKELDLLGSRNNAGLYAEAVRMVQRHQETSRSLVTHTFPLEHIAEAMAFGSGNAESVNKVMIHVGR
jgi:threonine dehydrogenase-like Zn-dependent dehydrogenase